VQGFKWTSNLQELSVKYDLAYFINTNNQLSFGYHLTGRRFSPGKIAPNTDGSIFTDVELQHMYALDHAFYVSNEQKLNENLSLDYGVRLSIFQNIGTSDVYLYQDPHDNVDIQRTDTLHYDAWQNIKTYVNLEPRLAMRYMIGEGSR
jgi:outer membrane receptor protein involved in Fe transport